MAGSSTERGYADGQALQARFSGDLSGLSYRADGALLMVNNHSVRQLTPSGTVVTLAGDGQKGYADGQGQSARFNSPSAAVEAPDGAVYVADTQNHLVRKLAADGTVTTFAGQAGVCGHVDGAGTAALLCEPTHLALDRAGNLYVAEQTLGWPNLYPDALERAVANPIRKITPAGVVSTFVAKASVYPSSASIISGASLFYFPVMLVVAPDGTLYTADPNDNVIRKYAPDGAGSVVSGVLAGRDVPWPAAENAGHVDGTSSEAKFWFGHSPPLARDASGMLYTLDYWTDASLRLRRIDGEGSVTTVMRVPGCEGNADIPGPGRCNTGGFTFDASGALIIGINDSGVGIYRYPLK